MTMTLTEQLVAEALKAPDDRKQAALKVLKGEKSAAVTVDPLDDLISSKEIISRFNILAKTLYRNKRLSPVMRMGGVNYYRRSDLHRYFPPKKRGMK
jgi:hypothetical protein